MSVTFFLIVVAGRAAAGKHREAARRLQRSGGFVGAIWITKEAGIFRKHGLDVELLFIPGGPLDRLSHVLSLSHILIACLRKCPIVLFA
jgi:hypothetical protein